jgi:hypothetical protein
VDLQDRDRGSRSGSIAAALGHPPRRPTGTPMFDFLMLAGGLSFFALSLGYVALCERL